jgi:hypothetical protein
MKVTVNGEKFDFDTSRKPMSELLAIENGLHCTYSKWEEDMRAGSARAMCGFIWLVWRRDGRDVKLEDILSGAVDFDTTDLDVEADEGEAGPTTPPPEASSSTAENTSEPSPSASRSGPGKSSSSTRTTSKP